MSSPKVTDRPALYQAAGRFIDEGLKRDGSLFLPGRSIWRADIVDDFRERFVGRGEAGRDSFEVKFQRQMKGADPDVAQFAAELLFVHCLTSAEMKPATVEGLVSVPLAAAPGTSGIPEDLRPALETGIAATGTGFFVHRYWMIKLLLDFVRAWKRDLTPARRDELLADPWAFKTFVAALEMRAAHTQREALLHLVHPATFEPIVSQRHKERIAQAFAEYGDPDEPDVDRRLAAARPRLANRFGGEFWYYQPHVRQRWDPKEDPWRQLVRWISPFIEWDRFDVFERDEKVRVAAELASARNALREGRP